MRPYSSCTYELSNAIPIRSWAKRHVILASIHCIVQDGEEDRLESGAQPASLVESSTFPQTTSDHLGRMIYC